jgi:autotransporter-associated beta strand protein
VIHELGGEIMIRENTDITCSTPLERPVGKSVKAISLPSDADFLAATNIGPARIVIEGVGEGATAFASFDKVKGVLGKVIVTSPGTGYDDTTKAFVCIPKHPNRRFECTVELMEEEGGDFVKSGEGGLALGCTNTYAGATIVKGGTLIAQSHWAFPSNTLLHIESGMVQLNHYKAFFECVEGVSGNVRCYLSPDKIINVRRLSLNASEAITFAEGVKMRVHGPWKISAADVAAAAGKTPGYSCPVEFTDTATIEFDGTEGLSKEKSPYVLCELADGVQFTGRPVLVNEDTLGERWALSMNGSSIRLKYRNPFALIVR